MAERYTAAIKDLQLDDRPRERLVQQGPGACTTSELIAILLRTGTAERSALGVADELIRHFGGLRGALNAGVDDLQKVKGIGPVKAIEIAAAAELGRRLSAVSPTDKPTIRCPADVSTLMMSEMRDEVQEHMKILILDTKNRVTRIADVTTGTLDSSLVHPREVFKPAIAASAAAIIAVHNHPSGDPTPSEEDRRITKRLVEAGEIIGIDLLDHIVIGHNRIVSMKEKGLM